MSERRYVSVTETAKEIRKALKANFPGVKFSVRSKSYSGGASVNVSWVDGPLEEAVSKVAKRYQGASFDGMVDLMEYHTDYLSNEDGSVEVVHWGADFVFCERSMSDETEKKIASELARVAHEAVYNDSGDLREFSPEQIAKGWDLRIPVCVPMYSSEEEPYFALSAEHNYAAQLVRQFFCRTDLYRKEA